MPDKPILFSAPMVRALLEGRKTQTRRVIIPQPRVRPELVDYSDGPAYWSEFDGDKEAGKVSLPIKAASDTRLWVREAFSDVYAIRNVRISARDPNPDALWYWADGEPTEFEYEKPRPSIHMPRWASRLTLTVTEVRVQQLQEITEADAKSEGMKPGYRWTPQDWFRELWDGLNASRGFGWDVNPWIAAYTFTVARENIDKVAA